MYWVGWVFQICAHIFAYLYLDTPILSINFSLIMSLTCPAPTPSTPSAGGISGALLEAGGAGGGNEGGTEGACLTGCIRPTAGEDRCTGADLLWLPAAAVLSLSLTAASSSPSSLFLLPPRLG